MEEHILEILSKGIYYSKEDVIVKTPLRELTKEIANDMRKFNEWLILNEKFIQCIDKDFDGTILRWGYQNFESKSDMKLYTFDELFTYWLDNVKNK